MDIYGILIKAAGFIVTFGLVVFFHEMGHFLGAIWMGVRVETFSLGFGKELFSFTRGKTKFRIAAFPLGGYCKMAGENKEDEVKGEPDEFLSKKWWRRLIIVFSGPFMNFVLAWLVFTMMMTFIGMDVPVKDAVVGGFPGVSPAREAGIMIGDKVVSIDGLEVESWKHMAETIHGKPEEPLEMKIIRGEKEMAITVIPKRNEESKVSLIGITPEFEKEKSNIFTSLWESIKRVGAIIYMTLHSLWLMIAGKVKPELAGPIGIITLVGQAVSLGISSFLNMIAVISIMLGIFNLLPIPIVDGGVIALLLVEAVRKKPLPDKFIELLQKVGFALIMMLVVFATYQDILRMFTKK